MNANDDEKRLDEYIDALNAGKPAPRLDGDAELSDIFATARDLQRLRLAEPPPNDVPSRLATALERELQANPTHATRRIESNDMSQFRDASSNGTIRPPDDSSSAFGMPQRPERARQLAQFALAAVAFVIVGVILAQIIGGGSDDEPSSAVGTNQDGTATTEVVAPEATPTVTALPPTSTPDATPSSAVTFTPGDEPGGAIPTPDESGAYNVLTFAEARELTEFEVIEPESVPQELTLEGIRLDTELDMSTPGSFQAGPVDLVTAYFQHSQSGSVQFWQTTRGCNDPGMVNAVHDDIEIDGKAIRRTLGTNQSGDPLASYRWQSGEICYMVFALLNDRVTEELLAALVSSIPQPGTAAEPSATPVAAQPEFATLSVSPDYVTCEDMVIASGTNFEPGSTVAIFGGPMIGDSFAPIVDEHPVADDGAFEVEMDLSRLIQECGGGGEQNEGSMFRLFASTGSALVRDGIDPDGPSAMTVVTFSRETPVGIRDRVRLPSCGTEVILNVTMSGERGTADQAARECFAAAVESGAIAEFTSVQQTIEGDIVTTIYNSLGSQDVDVNVDATRDRFGSGTWQRSTCVWNEMSNLEPYPFHFEYCGEPAVIE